MDSPEASPDTNLPGDGNPSSSPPGPSGQGNPPSKKALARKRTKTGCLTCRKRRIKCDEGKPTCNNCIKSKRQCEGYNQRLTFKEPLGSFPQVSFYGPSYHHQQARQDALNNAPLPPSQVKIAASQGPLAMIAPKPPSVDFTGTVPLQFGHAYHGPPSAPGPPMPSAHSLSPAMYSPQQQLPTPPIMVPEPSPPVLLQQSGPGDFRDISPSPQAFELNQPLEQVAEPKPEPEATSPRHPRYRARYRGSISEDEHSGFAQAEERRLSSNKAVEEEYWQSDDEASMVDSDDEPLPDTHLAHLESNDLGIQVAKRLESSLDTHGIRLRSFSMPGVGNILETYIPSSTSSPLNDPHTAAIFWYFVNMTGPSMSLYERHPFDPSPMFQGGPVPKARRHIWTYIFPIIAFSHPALMQAMLALGSLQMAKCEGLPATAAMKHYHLSLRRVAKNYQSPAKRTQPATLAATLLLGFYEVWNSDHGKWCRHMWGARAIIRELPLREMTKEILALKRVRRLRQLELLSQHQCDGSCFSLHAGLESDIDEIDADFIAQLTGQGVSYGDSGYVLDDHPRQSSRQYTERDIETYESLSDLYWWFCKMDVYQSVLGGTRPFMEYKHWTQCAPRAQFGRIDAVYGTFDHLMLLLGRLVTFASGDLARKRKARHAEAIAARNQGQARGTGPGPAPGQFAGLGPSSGPPPGHGPPPGQSPPMFAGLMPSSGHFTFPRGFSPPRDTSPLDESSENIDLDASTAAATREWEEIRQAFEVFRNRLGPDFAPLGLEHAAAPEMTPFGPALMYRTFSIAGIWMNYYMGLIVLYRALPSMPPIAMAAAGMAAPQTARWAYEIARIAAGLCEDLNNQKSVSMLIGAACIESSFCLFVAGVQYRELEQRHWLVRRLHNISRLTGWQSARQIADGCESAWIKASQLGRGPSYESPPDLGPLYPDSVWLLPRKIDRRIRDFEGADNKLVLARTEQAHYALGLLSVEQDLDRLDLVAD